MPTHRLLYLSSVSSVHKPQCGNALLPFTFNMFAFANSDVAEILHKI